MQGTSEVKRTKAGSIFAIQGESLLGDAFNAIVMAIKHKLKICDSGAVVEQGEKFIAFHLDLSRPSGVGAELNDSSVM